MMTHTEYAQSKSDAGAGESDALTLDKETVKDLESTSSDASAPRGGYGAITHSCVILCNLTK